MSPRAQLVILPPWLSCFAFCVFVSRIAQKVWTNFDEIFGEVVNTD